MFKLSFVRPAVVADGLAEMQVRFPTVPIVFCETRPLAQEVGVPASSAQRSPTTPSTTLPLCSRSASLPRARWPRPSRRRPRVRAWARAAGFDVPPKGRLRPEIWTAFAAARELDV